MRLNESSKGARVLNIPWTLERQAPESSRLALGKESTKNLGAGPERPITLERSTRSFIKIRNNWIDSHVTAALDRWAERPSQRATLILARLLPHLN
jgi:hypothetical protein